MPVPPAVAPVNNPHAIVFRLKSRDGVVVGLSEGALKQSRILRTTFRAWKNTPERLKNPFPVKDVDGKILELIAKWCEHHKYDTTPTDPDLTKPIATFIPAWDTKFLNMDNAVLFDLIVAANYLEIPRLLNYGCKYAAGMAKGKGPKELCAIYGIPTDEEDEAAGRPSGVEPNAPLPILGDFE